MMKVIAEEELTRNACFYCGAWTTKSGVGDHFPIPQRNGGLETVPACASCHSMKDNFPMGKWPMEWISKVMADMPKVSRETRIFLAKCITSYNDAFSLLAVSKKTNRSVTSSALK